MKRILLLAGVVVFVAGAVFAHGKEQHVKGTVTAIKDGSITVQTKAKDPVTVATSPATKYEKSGAAAGLADLRVGDRVVIHAEKMRAMLMANDVHFGVMRLTSAPH